MSERIWQNKTGTWLSHWSPESYDSTPPIEERIWICPGCFSKWSGFLRKLPAFFDIDWEWVAREIGSAQAEQFHGFLRGRFPMIWERVRDIHELALIRDVHCRSCRTCLTRTPEAFVEVC